MQQLEAFHYVTELDLNTGYSTIRIPTTIQDMKRIVTEFGKLISNRLPMGICDSRDIFQEKVYKPLSDIKGVKTYIYDILVLSKEIFSNHKYQQRSIFNRVRSSAVLG